MNPEKEKWVLLVVLSIIWGSSFILIKKSLEHFNPYEVGALRVLIAGIILMPLAVMNIKKFPKKHLKWLVLAALTGNFIPMFLFPIAETTINKFSFTPETIFAMFRMPSDDFTDAPPNLYTIIWLIG